MVASMRRPGRLDVSEVRDRLAGTGSYVNLTGAGRLEGVPNATGVLDTFMGTVHITS